MLETGTIVVLSVIIALVVTYLILPVINLWIGAALSLGQFLSVDKVLYLLIFTSGLILLAGYYPAVFLSGFNPITAITGKGRKLTRANQAFRKGAHLLSIHHCILVFDQYVHHRGPGQLHAAQRSRFLERSDRQRGRSKE